MVPAGFFSADRAVISGLSHALFLGLEILETATLLSLATVLLWFATEGELNRSARFVPTLRVLAGRPATLSSHRTPLSAPPRGVAFPPVPAGVFTSAPPPGV